jgi:hypothetical protein
MTVGEGRLRVLGPVDVEPSAIAFDREIAGMKATAANGRLMVADPVPRGGTMLAFMAISGTTAEELAERITHEGQDEDHQ